MRPEESATKSDIAVAAMLACVLRETHFERKKEPRAAHLACRTALRTPDTLVDRVEYGGPPARKG